MSYFEEPFVRVSWDENIEAVVIEWLGPARGEKLKSGLNAGLKLLAEKNKGKWLADTKKLGVFGQADEEWVNKDWLPQSLAAGLKKRAYVMSESALTRLALEAVVNRAW